MAELDDAHAAASPENVGVRLRAAREAAGLARADIAARTKIAERHLAAIEEGRLDALASSTYAVGFARAYARAVGLDERAIAQAVREELALRNAGPLRALPDTFEPGDPARVPGVRIAWVATAAAVLVVALVLFVWRSYWFPAATLPDLTRDPAEVVQRAEVPAALASQPAPVAGGPVVFTAREAGVWVRFTDAGGRQLLQKELALGESFTVPADAAGPVLRTARPDALDVTIGGRPVPRISDRQELVRDVPVTAAALLARGAPTPAATSAVVPLPTSASQPVVRPQRPAQPARPAASPSPSPTPPAAAESAPAQPAPAAAASGATVSE